MTPEQFREQLQKDQLPIDDSKMKQFDQYLHMLQEWNEKINLTAIVKTEEVYVKHFYDSLTLAKYITVEEGHPTLCDVGSGAGFPSIPLKILFPNIEVTIVDSLNKRITFLEQVVNELGLEGVKLYHDRAETFGQNKTFRASFDYVTARAVANLSVLSELCMPLNKIGGVFVAMKASSATEELEEATKAIKTLGGKFRQDIAFNLPESAGERHILLIDKKKETPNKYPRRPGTPAKNPLN